MWLLEFVLDFGDAVRPLVNSGLLGFSRSMAHALSVGAYGLHVPVRRA